MPDRKQTVKIILSLAALAFSALVIGTMLFPEGCGPSEEEQILRNTLNALPEITEKEAHIDELVMNRGKEGDDDVYRYEAEIVDAKGIALGRLRGGRVEGFGTMTPRIKWYATPGVKEEWAPPKGERSERPGKGERRERRERRQTSPQTPDAGKTSH